MPAKSTKDRVLIARIAAAERWAHERDPKAATAKARRAAFERFERAVDPRGTLATIERLLRAKNAQRAAMLRAARKSAQARRQK